MRGEGACGTGVRGGGGERGVIVVWRAVLSDGTTSYGGYSAGMRGGEGDGVGVGVRELLCRYGRGRGRESDGAGWWWWWWERGEGDGAGVRGLYLTMYSIGGLWCERVMMV